MSRRLRTLGTPAFFVYNESRPNSLYNQSIYGELFIAR
jgi:hypothetical protein